MAAQTKNLYLEQGATLRRGFTYYPRSSVEVGEDGDVTVIGPPYDLTLASARMQIRRKPGGEVLISLTSVDGGIVLGGVAGTVDIVIDEETSEALPVKPREYQASYDLEIQFPSGDVDRVIEGTVLISPDITRA
jgi:hypothetical protein